MRRHGEGCDRENIIRFMRITFLVSRPASLTTLGLVLPDAISISIFIACWPHDLVCNLSPWRLRFCLTSDRAAENFHHHSSPHKLHISYLSWDFPSENRRSSSCWPTPPHNDHFSTLTWHPFFCIPTPLRFASPPHFTPTQTTLHVDFCFSLIG